MEAAENRPRKKNKSKMAYSSSTLGLPKLVSVEDAVKGLRPVRRGRGSCWLGGSLVKSVGYFFWFKILSMQIRRFNCQQFK